VRGSRYRQREKKAGLTEAQLLNEIGGHTLQLAAGQPLRVGAGMAGQHRLLRPWAPAGR
jgi:hypothetical protein